MGQTEAVCPVCGFDFPAPAPPGILWGLFERQSSIRGWLVVISVLTIPFAFVHYVPRGAQPGAIAAGLLMCCLLCRWLLRRDPHWSTAFEVLALLLLLSLCVLPW